jgi:hypothetical protein
MTDRTAQTAPDEQADRVFRPFFPVRTWLAATAGLLLTTVVLAAGGQAEAVGPALLASVVTAVVLGRSAHNWRVWNTAVADHRAREARAAQDARDRELYRKWLRQQVGQDS